MAAKETKKRKKASRKKVASVKKTAAQERTATLKKVAGKKIAVKKRAAAPTKVASTKKTARAAKAARKKAGAGSEAIRAKVDQLSEALIFADPSDPKALADLLIIMEEISQWAADTSLGKVSAAMEGVIKFVEEVILDEVSDPLAAMDVVGKTVSALQVIVCEGRDAEEVDFPPELDLGEGQKKGGAGVALPAHVDEAIFAEFLSRQSGVLEEMEALVLVLEKGDDESSLGELRRSIHTLKGESALLGLYDVERLCHATEDLLEAVSPSQVVDVLLAVKDWLGRTFDVCSGAGAELEPVEQILERVTSAQGIGEARGAAEQPAEAEPAAAAAAEPNPLDGDLELLGDFISEARDHLDAADLHLLTLETEPEDEEALNAVFRAFHTIKGVAGFLALNDIGSLSHEAENLLDKARRGEMVLVGDAIDITFDAVDMLKTLVGHLSSSLASGEPLAADSTLPSLLSKIEAVASGKVEIAPEAAAPGPAAPRMKLGELLLESGAVTSAELGEAISEQEEPPEDKKLGEILVEDSVTSRKRVEQALEAQKADSDLGKLGEIMVQSGTVSEEDVERALKKQKTPPSKPRLGEVLVREKAVPAKEIAQTLRSQKYGRRAVHVKETLKVDSDRLGRLVEMIGELVIAESMVSQSLETSKVTSTHLSRQIRQLDKITRELQELGTSLRMVPVRSTFQKMARLIRDLAKKAGKKVEFVMSGEDTELDKTVVDRIGDPLVHMVRNAVDHGIEASPEERVKAGKPAIGRVELRAFHKGGSIFIEIEDDGRGLDREAILAKAMEKGLVKDGASLSEREVFNLIFEPGFSTAKKVTDVSGRGVGMDVVRRNIEALRGQTEIRSEKGKGSVFTLRLPLTLAIIDGMVVCVGPNRFIIPTLSIIRSIRPRKEDITTVLGRGEMLTVQSELIPLFRLSKLFSIEGAKQDPTEGTVVVVEDDGKQTGILTDELQGQLQIVIKSLGELSKETPGISGGAIMPDGRVGLILDVGGLVKLAHLGNGKAKAKG